MRSLTHEEWKQEGARRFGKNSDDWRFVCPSCCHEAAVADWKAAGAPEGTVAFSCIGRYVAESESHAAAAFKHRGGPCNYAGGGLFRLNPVKVRMPDGSAHDVMEFAGYRAPPLHDPYVAEAGSSILPAPAEHL